MKKLILIWITTTALSLTMVPAHAMSGGWGDGESLRDDGGREDGGGHDGAHHMGCGHSASVPEPGTLGLLALGVAGLAATRRKKK